MPSLWHELLSLPCNAAQLETSASALTAVLQPSMGNYKLSMGFFAAVDVAYLCILCHSEHRRRISSSI